MPSVDFITKQTVISAQWANDVNNAVYMEVNATDSQFGLVADGVTDDTAALNAATAYAFSLFISNYVLPFDIVREGGVVVNLPAGKIKTTGTINEYPGVIIRGKGMWSTVVYPTANTDVFKNVLSNYDQFGQGIQDLSIHGNNAGSAQHGISILRDWFGSYRNVVVTGCGGHGWRFYQSIGTQMDNCWGSYNGLTGISISGGINSWADTTPNGLPSNQFVGVGCLFTGNNAAGIALDDCMGCTFYSTTSESNYASSQGITPTGYNIEVTGNSPVPNQFINCWTEGGVFAHLSVNMDDIAIPVMFIGWKQFAGPTGNVKRAAVVTRGTLHLVNCYGQNEAYPNIAGSTAPYRVTTPNAKAYLTNCSGNLVSNNAFVEDQTGATTGLDSYVSQNNWGISSGPTRFYNGSGVFGPEFQREGDAQPYAAFSPGSRGLSLGDGTGAPDAGIRRLAAGVVGPYAAQRIVPREVSANRGDNNVTLTMADKQVQIFTSALTANRTVTLPAAAGTVNGDRFEIVRTGLGAFTLDVGGLKTIPAGTAATVTVTSDGSAWRLTQYGTL